MPFYINVQVHLLKFSYILEYKLCLIMLYILYIARTDVGDWHLFQIGPNVLFVALFRLEIKFFLLLLLLLPGIYSMGQSCVYGSGHETVAVLLPGFAIN